MSLSHAGEAVSGGTYAARWAAATVERLEGGVQGAVAGLIARPWRYRAILSAAHDIFYGEQTRLQSSWANATGRGLLDAAKSMGSSFGLQGLARRLAGCRRSPNASSVVDVGFGTGAFARDFGYADGDVYSGMYLAQITVRAAADNLPYLRRLADAFHVTLHAEGSDAARLEFTMRGDVLQCAQGLYDMALHLQLHGFGVLRLKLKLQLLRGASGVSFPTPPLRLPSQGVDSRYLSALQHYEVVVNAAAPIAGLDEAFPHSTVDPDARLVGRACFRDISYTDAAAGAEDFCQAVAARAGINSVDAFVVVYDTHAPE
jgi:hypothetical protein